MKKLGQHLADWEETIGKYGQHLMRCPDELRTMTLGVIPKSYEDELMHKEVEYPTWRSVISYCTKRTRTLQHRAYADLVRHPRSPSVKGSMHAFAGMPKPSDGDVQDSPHTEEAAQAPPSWASDLINAVRELRGARSPPPPPAPAGGVRPPRGAAAAKAVAKPKAGAAKFIFPGCWECGEEGHQRHECGQWKKACGPSGAPPQGHKGARDRAYAKWKANKTRARVNNFELDEEDVELDDEYDPMMFVLVSEGTAWDKAQCGPSVRHDAAQINTFAELDTEEPEQLADSLNKWAHAVIDEKQKISQKQRKKNSRKPLDLNAVKALPSDFASLAKIAKNHPGNHLLKPGEQWVIMDSGANLDAANIVEHFPEYVHLIDQSNLSDGGAECASGDVVKCRGTVQVNGSLDGQSTSIHFRDMKIKMPIASMKKRVEGADGYDVFITEGGAVMRHRKNGALVKLYDRGGVYFAKFKTKLPNASTRDPDSLFVRRG